MLYYFTLENESEINYTAIFQFATGYLALPHAIIEPLRFITFLKPMLVSVFLAIPLRLPLRQ